MTRTPSVGIAVADHKTKLERAARTLFIRRARFLIPSLNAYWQERLGFIEFFASRYFWGANLDGVQQVHGLWRNLKCSVGRTSSKQTGGVRPKLFLFAVNEASAATGGDRFGCGREKLEDLSEQSA